jgi:hypothetical protein
MNDQPRGIRNNNGGNIRLGQNWEGLVDEINGVSDSPFCQFIDPQHGIRAINHILNAYAGRGVTTVQAIINAWSPPSENDTGAYVSAVAGSMGVTPDTVVTNDLRASLIAAIILHENGQQPYDASVISAGIALA